MLPYRSHTLRRLAPMGAAWVLACASSGSERPPTVEDARVQVARGDGVDATAACRLGRSYRQRGTIQGRLLSQCVLEAARARHPDDPDVAMELAQTYFAQRFFPDAVRICRGVLARDSARCDARALLARYHYQNWKRMNEYVDDLADARRELRSAFACDSNDVELGLHGLVAGYARGDDIASECDALVARFPARPEFLLMRGAIAFEAVRYDACARDFAAAFERMDEATRAAYGSLTHVLGAADDALYRQASVGVREDFQRGLWLVADPDPTTEVNPRALEHVYRMFVADCLYSNQPGGRRGWETDRGEAFVRFGRPLEIAYTMGGGFASGKVETWTFVTGGISHQLVFVDEFLNGNPRIPYHRDITLHFMRNSPAATTLPPEAAAIPGLVDALAFRDDAMSGSIYLAMAVDADALRAVTGATGADGFLLRGAYFDESWRRQGAFCDSVRADAMHETRTARGRGLEVVRRVRVPCDRYHVALAFEDASGVARATGRRDADALRFGADGLALSDILLLHADPPAPGQAAIERGGARMRPNVERLYARGERLRAYVEIYNLSLATRGAERVSVYDLRFAIFPARAQHHPDWVDWGRRAIEWVGFGKDEDATISQTFRREGRAHDDRESIAIDVDALEDGRYDLVVEVTDRRSGARAVGRAAFWKESAAVAGARR